MASVETGFVNNVQFNFQNPTSEVVFLRTLDPDSLGYDNSHGRYVSMVDGQEPNPLTPGFSDTTYLTTLTVNGLTSSVQYLTDQHTYCDYLDSTECSFDGSSIYRLVDYYGTPSIVTYTQSPYAFSSVYPLSPSLSTCFGLTVNNGFDCLAYHTVGGAGTSSSSTGFNGGATGSSGVLLGRRKL